MKISVIICAYNAEKTLDKCLESVCNQSFAQLEILAINDGSTESTLEIMKRYADQDSRIKIIDQENMGAGCAKNVGLKEARGDYITFVDSDDWIEQDTYKVVAEKIKETDCDMVLFNHNKIFGDRIEKNARPIKNEILDLNKMGRDTYIVRYLISYNHDLGACNKVVRRSIIANNGIEFSDNRKVMYDDNMYTLKLICHTNILVSVSESFYNYVISENSITGMKNTNDRMAKGYTQLMEEYVTYLKKIGMYAEISPAMPLLYYSMAIFGLIRMKHFGHFDVLSSLNILKEFSCYREYMEQVSKFRVRKKYITQTLRKVYFFRNWQLTGLLFLTLVQGKVVSYYALKDEVQKMELYL